MTKTSALSMQQEAYLAATAVVDTLAIEVLEAVDALGIDDSTDEGLNAHCLAWVRAEADLGYDDAKAIQRQAADALLAWGHGVVKSCPQYKPVREVVEEMYGKVNRFPVHKQKLIELTMKLRAR